MKARIIYMGKIGRRLEGPAIGKLLAKFLNNCRDDEIAAVIECSEVDQISKTVIKTASKFIKNVPIFYVVNANEEIKKSFSELTSK
ncbi:MAG: hypothetical protein WBK47_01130 [Acetomicrobium sp.]|jgi:hypothetical protein